MQIQRLKKSATVAAAAGQSGGQQKVYPAQVMCFFI
jgi:hypothetical protein